MRYYQFIFSALTAMYLLGFACQLGAEKVMIKNYDASDITGLSVSGRFSRVEIVPSEKGFVEVEVAGAKEVSKRVEVFLKNGMLCIRNAASSSVQRVDKSLNIAIGNAQSTLTIGNKSLSSSLVDPEISVTIYCPEAIDLQASGVFELLSSVPLSNIDLKMLSGGSARLEKCGSESVRVESVGDASLGVFSVHDADVSVKVVGGGRANLNGSFRSVTVESVGDSEVQTSGPVAEKYSLSIVGSGALTHSGRIFGRIEKSVIGDGRFVHVEE